MAEEVNNQNPKPQSRPKPHIERPEHTGAKAKVNPDPRRFPPKK